MRRLLIAILAVAGLSFGVVGWHYSSEIIGPDRPPEKTGQTVLATTAIHRSPSGLRCFRLAIAKEIGTWTK